MKAGWIGRALAATALLVLAGCGGDVATEIRTNAPLRDRVMETMLHDKSSAQYVLMRIGTNPDAVDLVLQTAASDSVGREHLMTLLKGMQMALKAGTKP